MFLKSDEDNKEDNFSSLALIQKNIKIRVIVFLMVYLYATIPPLYSFGTLISNPPLRINS